MIDWPEGEKDHNAPCTDNTCFTEILNRFGEGEYKKGEERIQFAYVLIHLKSTEMDGQVSKPQNQLIFCTYCDDAGNGMNKFRYAGSKASVIAHFNFHGTTFQFNDEADMTDPTHWMEEFESNCVKNDMSTFEGLDKIAWGDL